MGGLYLFYADFMIVIQGVYFAIHYITFRIYLTTVTVIALNSERNLHLPLLQYISLRSAATLKFQRDPKIIRFSTDWPSWVILNHAFYLSSESES